MTRYKIYVSIDGQNFFWIIVENGKIINKNPAKEDLGDAKAKYYNKTSVCPRCREEGNITDDSILYPKNSYHEKNKDGKETGEWICPRHWRRDYNRYDPYSTDNIKKSLRNCRKERQDPNCPMAKGEQDVDIACELYGYINLNKANDNYSSGSPIDCYDPKTGLYHQVQGRRYNYINMIWGNFSGLDEEWEKEFEDMILFCKSKDGKIIERIYKIPFEKEIKKKRKGISIYKNPSRGVWYEKYRVRDEAEIERANNILKRKLDEQTEKDQKWKEKRY